MSLFTPTQSGSTGCLKAVSWLYVALRAAFFLSLCKIRRGALLWLFSLAATVFYVLFFSFGWSWRGLIGLKGAVYK